MRSLYIALIYLAFIVLGVAAPFAFTLGYVWVSIFRPHDIAYEILNLVPVSMIMGALAVGSYFLLDRRSPPPVTSQMVLVLLLAAWVTITTMFFAVAPSAAWEKWDWAFKTLVFSAFIPFVIRSRIQIEAFMLIYVFSLAIHVLPIGLKTIISGGGYGKTLGILSSNHGLSESSTVATVALMMLPMILYLRQYSKLIPRTRITDLMYLGLALVAVAGAIGTYARTGMIGMAVVGVALWLRSRHKVLFGMVGAVALAAVTMFTSDAWNDRMSTVATFQSENSALIRILVWRWTLGFVADNPMGGGFGSYVVNEIRIPSPPGSEEPDIVQRGRAFHSVYFEILGEHGWPGLALFFALVLASFLSLHRVARWARKTEGLEWLRDLAYALEVALVTLLACGAFIGIAFQPMYYYLFALSACLTHQMYRLRQGDQPTYRAAGLAKAASSISPPRLGGLDATRRKPPPVGAKLRG